MGRRVFSHRARRWLAWLGLAVFFVVSVVGAPREGAAGDRYEGPSDYEREKWGANLAALHDKAVRGDVAALMEMKKLADAEEKRTGGQRSYEPGRALEAAMKGLLQKAPTDATARAALVALVNDASPGDRTIGLMMTDLAVLLARQDKLSASELSALAKVVASFDRVPGGVYRAEGEKVRKLVEDELNRGNLEVRRILGAAVRSTLYRSGLDDGTKFLLAYYEKADPKTFDEEDWITIALVAADAGTYDKIQGTLRAGMASNPAARAAIRDLLLDRVPGLDHKDHGSLRESTIQTRKGVLAKALVDSTPMKDVSFTQAKYGHQQLVQTNRVHDFSFDDEFALRAVLPKLRDLDKPDVQRALDGWKLPASQNFARKVEAEFVPEVKAYVDAKQAAAKLQFDALNARIKAAGAQGEISQADADRFRKELFDVAAKVAGENQSGAVKSGNKVITPGYLVEEVVRLSREEARFGGTPHEGLGIARGLLTDLDRFTLQQIQESAALVLSKDERIALEDAIINEHQAALREQMAEQAILLNKVFDKVAAPARKPPSGPITVLQDFIKYEIGSENSYHAMVERLLKVDTGKLFDKIPKKGAKFTPAQYRAFMEERDKVIEEIRAIDKRVAEYLESQKEWKDGITSIGAVGAAAVLAIPTGGQSLWITVPVLAGTGAATKVGLAWGDDYLGGREYTLKQGLRDGVIGAVDGASVLAGGSLSSSARMAVGKRLGLGLMEKGLTRELNLTGATILQRFLVHSATTTSRGATFGALTGFTRKTYDKVEAINAGREAFGLHTLGEIASSTVLSAGAGAVLDFGLSSAFSGLGRLMPKRPPNSALDAESEALLWRFMGAEKPGDLNAANGLLKAKFPAGYADGVLTQEQTLALEAYARLVKAKGWTGDPAALQLQVVAPKLNPGDSLAIGDTLAPSPQVFRTNVRVRVVRSSGEVEPNWTIDAINADGSLRVVSPDGAVQKAVSPQKLLEQNPELLIGLGVRTTRTSGVVEENWRVREAAPGTILLEQPSTGIGRVIDSGGIRAFIAQNADRWSPPALARLIPEGLAPPRATVSSAPARKVSEDFRLLHRMEGNQKIPDGYVDGGRGMKIGADGVVTSPNREVLVVDRARDAMLRQQIDFARDLGARVKAGKLGEEEAYRELAKFIDRAMSPGGNRNLAHAEMDRWVGNAQGREVLIGDVTRFEAGMCRHRGLLFKVLGDELGEAAGRPGQVALVRGNMVWEGGGGGHVWNELTLPSGQKVLVDVMNPKPGFAFPKLETAATNYVRVDGKPWYAGGKVGGGAADPGASMILEPGALSLERARALAAALQEHPLGGLTKKEDVWAAIRAAQDKGVGDLYRAEIQKGLLQQLEQIERIKVLPGRAAEANAEFANVSMRAKAAGLDVDELVAHLAATQKARAEHLAAVGRATHLGKDKYPKHFRAKDDAGAAGVSKEGSEPVGQFLPSKFGANPTGDAARKELERAALLDPKAIRVENGGAVHVYWEAPEVVGFSNGEATRWMRVELSGGTIHSHPRVPKLFPGPVQDQVRIRAILDERVGPAVPAVARPGACEPSTAPPP